MQSNTNSNSVSGEQEISSGPAKRPLANMNAFQVTPEDAEILTGYLDEFDESNTAAKRKILEKAMGDLYRLRPNDFIFDKREAKEVCVTTENICALAHMLRDLLLQKIRRWFYNHLDSPNCRTIKFVRKWSARNVLYHEKKKDITDRARQVSGGAPGSEAFLGELQNTITHFWNELSDAEIDEYEDKAAEWTVNVPPPHIQRR